MTGRRPAVLAVLLAWPWAPAGAAPVRQWEIVDQSGESAGLAVAADANGVSYVGGRAAASASSPVLPFLRRYSTNGGVAWTVTQFGTAGSTSYVSAVHAVALLPISGTAYDLIVGGALDVGGGNGLDAFLARVTPAGATVWVQAFPSPGLDEAVRAVAISPAGEIWAAGRIELTPGDGDPWIARLDANGTPLCQTVASNLIGLNDAALGVAVDASGSVYAAGIWALPGVGDDGWVAKFAPTCGAPLWTVTLNGGLGSTDFAGGIAVAPGGDLLVAGGLTGATTRLDAFVARIAGGGTPAEGTVLWARTLDGGETDDDRASACAVAADGTVVVAGSVDRTTPVFEDLWLATLDAAGSVTSETDRNYSGNYVDVARAVALNTAGRIWVAGEVTVTGNARRAVLGSYLTLAPPAQVSAPVKPGAAIPNPFRPGSGGPQDAAGVSFRPVPAGSTARVYTLGGGLVAELADTDGDGMLFWNGKATDGNDAASGIYLYAVKAPDGKITRGKVVVIR